MQAQVSNPASTAVSDVATVTILQAPDVPVIEVDLQDTWVAVGTSVALQVVATSTAGPLTYQWRKNGVAIAGATTDTYVP